MVYEGRYTIAKAREIAEYTLCGRMILNLTVLEVKKGVLT